MGVTAATLAGHRATRARVQIPAWGLWYADVSLDGEHRLKGAVELVVADLKLQGTVLSGGPMHGRSTYRIVGGRGGWGKTIKAEHYANDALVKAATVLSDAARVAGETIDVSGVAISERVGPAFVRPRGRASAVLEQLKPEGWYVGEDGITRIGRRASKTLTTPATRVEPVNPALAKVTLAAESIAPIVPGIVVDGLEAIDVEHAISAKGLRSTLWGSLGAGGMSRELAVFKRFFEQLDPFRRFRGITEYRVVTLSGKRLNLQPILKSSGMPDLRRVSMWPGVSGCEATLKLGSRVLVQFIGDDPSRPIVTHFEETEGEGFKPMVLKLDAVTFVKLGAGVKPAIAAGDLAGGLFPVAPTQAKVLI